MKILLINPPYAVTEPPGIPMGLLYIGAAIEEAGHEVRILDFLVRRTEKKAVQEIIEEFDPSIVGITSVTMNWHDASEILRWVKEIDPKIYTVAGGPHVTFTWNEISEKEPWVDYVVLSEGERTIVELIHNIENKKLGHSVAGLVWRENGGMIAGPPRAFEQNLNLLPKPALHLFDLPRYRAMWAGPRVSTGRGCPFFCTFCVGPKMVGHRPRLIEPAKVVDEIERVVDQGFREIAFSDDHFGMKRDHAMAVCDEIISRGIDVDLSIFIRADAAEPELLEKMRQAGCTGILFGAESGVQSIVDKVKKKTDLEMLKKKVKLALDMDYMIQVSFILGLPGETRETIEQTFDYALNLGVFPGMHVLSPLPGSEIYENAEELGLHILHRDWSRYDANHVVSETDGISAAEIEKIIAKHESDLRILEKMDYESWKKGELSGRYLKNVDRRRCTSFFFNLFTQGFFESELCQVDKHEDQGPSFEIIRNASKLSGVDEIEASKWITRALDMNDLKVVQRGDRVRYEFINTHSLVY